MSDAVLPNGPWIGSQQWRQLLFAHYPGDRAGREFADLFTLAELVKDPRRRARMPQHRAAMVQSPHVPHQRSWRMDTTPPEIGETDGDRRTPQHT